MLVEWYNANKSFIIIFLIVNLVVFAMYGIDKWKAIHHKWRIPEATLIGAAVFGVVGIAGLLLVLIPILRELIFLFYYQRVRIADYFETQADLLEMNAYNIQNNNATFTKEERKSISNKQMAIATKFRKVSDFIAVDAKAAEVKATKEIASNKKKYKADEVLDEVPDSAAAALF